MHEPPIDIFLLDQVVAGAGLAIGWTAVRMFVPKDMEKRSQSSQATSKASNKKQEGPIIDTEATEEVSEWHQNRGDIALLFQSCCNVCCRIQARRLARELRDFDELLATREYERRTSGDKWGKGGR